eukprot:CAMPEP_0194157040 /NCGR_PEP_ID=MMETSP0152-20130528/70481_1 /TAXON_ID=1049557 /ORGANISM="Thalassiothrix antarctica, Strain L6-D1" /LENGTH=593 /DNA_ID=CAMNT_0038865157 /DNA_START=287 /DNA_END=2065 /DNA_ORIENTATION=-
MDFSSQLANLQRTVAAAASRKTTKEDSSPRGNNNNDNSGHDYSYYGRPNDNGRGGVGNNSNNQNQSNHNSNNRGRRRHYNNNNNNYCNNNNKRHRPNHHGPPGPYRSVKWNTLKNAIDTLPSYEELSSSSLPTRTTKTTAAITANTPETSNSSKFKTAATTTNLPSSINNKTFHLCLLAITIDDLLLEEIWKEWADYQCRTIYENYQISLSISLIGHAKNPSVVKSAWYQSHLLVNSPRMGRGNTYAPPTYHTRHPAWGSIDITRAMLDLCHEAMQIGAPEPKDPNIERDPRFSANRYLLVQHRQQQQEQCSSSTKEKDNDHSNSDDKETEQTTTSSTTNKLPPIDSVVFISETCLPVSNLTLDLLLIAGRRKSIVNYRFTPNNGFSRQLQFDKIHSAIPTHKRVKADQWMWLCRSHLQHILNTLPHNLWECFLDCNASDELYFPTALSVLGILANPNAPATDENKDTITDYSQQQHVTSTPEAGSKNENTIKNQKEQVSTDAAVVVETTKSLYDKTQNSSSVILPKNKEVSKRRITYCDWSMNAKNPASFDVYDTKELKKVFQLAKQEKCLLARKFIIKSSSCNNGSLLNAW